MKVNDLVKTIGYTRNRLDHFVFYLWRSQDDKIIKIDNPTLDEYVFLCDREVNDWIPSGDDTDRIDVTIDLVTEDLDIFANRK